MSDLGPDGIFTVFWRIIPEECLNNNFYLNFLKNREKKSSKTSWRKRRNSMRIYFKKYFEKLLINFSWKSLRRFCENWWGTCCTREVGNPGGIHLRTNLFLKFPWKFLEDFLWKYLKEFLCESFKSSFKDSCRESTEVYSSFIIQLHQVYLVFKRNFWRKSWMNFKKKKLLKEFQQYFLDVRENRKAIPTGIFNRNPGATAIELYLQLQQKHLEEFR